ncbi:MAG: DUF5107 domain-containing protein [Anaerolineae bacterium]|jgi:uncharacterized repeat protein (TIGR01451 family)|nr:DUF5107 domain-containing protein [Anaerolineae bacterium]
MSKDYIRRASRLLTAVLVMLAMIGPYTAVFPTASGPATVQVTSITIPSYPYYNHLQVRHNGTYNMYYFYLDWGAYYNSHPHATPRTLTAVVLENDYLKLTILPEIGGRIYSCLFKPTENNELYSNTVLKPTHWGPPDQGWWLAAGGMEWCLPVEEHGYETVTAWSYTTVSATDGVTVTLQDTTANDRLRATINVYLPADRACFVVQPRIENPTASSINYKYWTNAQIAPGPLNTLSSELRFVFPVDQVTVHSTGDSSLPGPGRAMSWPWYNGRDMSRLGNWNGWLGFFERPAAQHGFMGAYDPSVDEGIVRIFPENITRGAKGFAFGWTNKWPSSDWTDDHTYYAELHGGLAPTFDDSVPLAAGTHVEWSEVWYPVAGIGGLTFANREAALYLNQSGSTAQVGVHGTRPLTHTHVVLWRTGDAQPLLVQQLSTLGPAHPFSATTTTDAPASQLVLTYLDDAEGLLATTATALDRTRPTSIMSALPPYTTTTAFPVAWSGTDMGSCVLDYDVQFKDGYEGVWTDWLTQTQSTSAIFSGQDGHTYFFRSRARDVFGNWGNYGDAEWGDTFTSVLVNPAAVLVTSRKTSERPTVEPGGTLTYTIYLHNTGNLAAASVSITDPVPSALEVLTPTLTASLGEPYYDSGTITWQHTISAGQVVTITFAIRPLDTTPRPVTITNTVEINDGQGVFVRRALIGHGYYYYMPLITKGYSP